MKPYPVLTEVVVVVVVTIMMMMTMTMTTTAENLPPLSFSPCSTQ
jgi:hypothetical protein